MTLLEPRTTKDVPNDYEEQAKMVVVAAFSVVRAIRDISDTLRDIHAVLETISRNQRK